MTNKKLWLLLPLMPLLIFASQGPILLSKLSSIGCTQIEIPSTAKISCNEGNCVESLTLSSAKRFLVLGHIVKAHGIFDADTGAELLPVSSVKSLLNDKWPELFVYDIGTRKKVEARMSYPQMSSLKGFSGVAPRECANESVISAVTIPSTLTTFSKTFLASFVLMFFLAAWLTTTSSPGLFKNSKEYLSLCFIVFVLSFLVGDHYFDSLKTTLRMSQDCLRTLALIALALPIVGLLKKRSAYIFIALVAAGSFWIADHSFLSIIGMTTPYRLGFPLFTFAAIASLAYRRDFTSILVISPTVIDSFHISGIRIADYPPIYFNLFVTGAWAMKVSWDQGAGTILPLAFKAAELIRRNIAFNTFSQSLANVLDSHSESPIANNDKILGELERSIKLIPKVIGCKKVTLSLLPISGHPITLMFDATTDMYREINDGKIDGYIFSRVLLYKDTFWFQTIDGLRDQGHSKLKQETSLKGAKYFCALPVYSGKSLVGILALTKFDDKNVDRGHGDYKEQIKLHIEMVKNRLEATLQSLTINDLEHAKNEGSRIRRFLDGAYVESKDHDEFLKKFAVELTASTGAATLIFERSSVEQAVLSCNVGLSKTEKDAWQLKPLNTNPNTGNKIGPFIVAFNESKSSYVKNISEISDQLHPYSQDLFKMMNAVSVLTIPIEIPNAQYVIALISRADTKHLSYNWLDILESVTPMVVASIQSLERASSIEAYGKIASRFIDDTSTRDTLFELAKKGSLPATLGRELESVIVVVDIVGSSNMSDNPMLKAELYGKFYNSVGRIWKEAMGLSILKRAGDGVIIGGISDKPESLRRNNISAAAQSSVEAAKSLGCIGARVCVHYGKYFIGLIGTDSSGSLDAIGLGIDHAFKLEEVMKSWKADGVVADLGISEAGIKYIFGSKPECTPSGDSNYFGSYLLFSKCTSLADYPITVLIKNKKNNAA